MIPDLRWYDDLDVTGNDVANDTESLEQDCYHVIIEDPGSNLADPDSGLGVANALSGTADPALASLAEAQLAADERVGGVEASSGFDGAGKETLDVSIEANPDYVDTTDTIEMEIPITGGIS